jgi:hypothetical protein
MTTPQKPLPKVPPFFPTPEKPPIKKKLDMRGMLSILTMVVSMGALTVSMLGAAIFVFNVFNDGLEDSLDGLPVKLVVLGIAFVFGWGVGLVCIRGFNNLVYPLVIQIFAWASVIAVSILYLKVIQKLYNQSYDLMHFWAYLLMLLGGLFVLICLHLLLEDHDLRPFAIPLLIIGVLQLFAIVSRYIFDINPDPNPSGWWLLADLAIFVVMTTISVLMLMHLGFLESVRYFIDELFSDKQTTGNNWNGEI